MSVLCLCLVGSSDCWGQELGEYYFGWRNWDSFNSRLNHEVSHRNMNISSKLRKYNVRLKIGV